MSLPKNGNGLIELKSEMSESDKAFADSFLDLDGMQFSSDVDDTDSWCDSSLDFEMKDATESKADAVPTYDTKDEKVAKPVEKVQLADLVDRINKDKFDPAELLIKEFHLEYPIDRPEASLNSLLVAAAKKGLVYFVKYALARGANNFSDALDVASKHPEVVKLVSQAQYNHQLTTEKHPLANLQKESFICTVIIRKADGKEIPFTFPTARGLALLMEYFSKKSPNSAVYNSYICSGEENLEHAFSLIKQAQANTRFNLIIELNVFTHWFSLENAKDNDGIKIVSMDSVAGDLSEEFYRIPVYECGAKVFEEKDNAKFYFGSDVTRQSSRFLCGIFATKDQRKAFKNIPLATKLKLFNPNDSGDELSYIFPPFLLTLTESMKRLEQYASDYPEEADIPLKTKEGLELPLMQYALRPRNKYNVVTPETIPNRDYSAEQAAALGADYNVPQTIKRNRSPQYFCGKYISELEDMCNKMSLNERARLVEKYNAKNLIMHNGQVLSKIQHEELFRAMQSSSSSSSSSQNTSAMFRQPSGDVFMETKITGKRKRDESSTDQPSAKIRCLP